LKWQGASETVGQINDDGSIDFAAYKFCPENTVERTDYAGFSGPAGLLF
jgi:hypothetical protein